MLEIMIWVGAAISLCGLGVLVWCIVRVARARRARLPDAQMREVLARVMPYNLAAFMGSVLGLMLIVIGILLG